MAAPRAATPAASSSAVYRLNTERAAVLVTRAFVAGGNLRLEQWFGADLVLEPLLCAEKAAQCGSDLEGSAILILPRARWLLGGSRMFCARNKKATAAVVGETGDHWLVVSCYEIRKLP